METSFTGMLLVVFNTETLFHIFINELEEKPNSFLEKFAHETQVIGFVLCKGSLFIQYVF